MFVPDVLCLVLFLFLFLLCVPKRKEGMNNRTSENDSGSNATMRTASGGAMAPTRRTAAAAGGGGGGAGRGGVASPLALALLVLLLCAGFVPSAQALITKTKFKARQDGSGAFKIITYDLFGFKEGGTLYFDMACVRGSFCLYQRVPCVVNVFLCPCVCMCVFMRVFMCEFLFGWFCLPTCIHCVCIVFPVVGLLHGRNLTARHHVYTTQRREYRCCCSGSLSSFFLHMHVLSCLWCLDVTHTHVFLPSFLFPFSLDLSLGLSLLFSQSGWAPRTHVKARSRSRWS